jgi:hypothetical protein
MTTVSKTDGWAKARAAKAAKQAVERGESLEPDGASGAPAGPTVLEAPVSVAPPAPPVDDRLDKVLELMQSLAGKVELATDRLDNLESERPKFVPMTHEDPLDDSVGTYIPPEALMGRAMKALKGAGDKVGGGSQYIETREARDKIPPQYRPVFRSGDQVRINPESQIHGAVDNRGKPKIWGDVLTARGINGRGEIMATLYITKSYEPKYRVHIPGLTRKNGDGYRESELLPA